jgi:hypothetical protein
MKGPKKGLVCPIESYGEEFADLRLPDLHTEEICRFAGIGFCSGPPTDKHLS